MIRDLASISQSVPSAWASRANRLRVFKEYLEVTRLGPTEKDMIRLIVREMVRLEGRARSRLR